jgi:hypothetical protein
MQLDARLRKLAPAATGLLLLVAMSSCAGRSKPVLPKVESERETPRAAPAAPAEDATPPGEGAAVPSPASPEEVKKTPSPNTIEIEGEDAGKKPSVSLLEASRAEKARRAKAQRPVAVITNKTLSQYNKGQLTIADPKAPKAPKTVGEPPSEVKGGRGEDYWKTRGLDIRTHWRESADRVKEFEQSAADWRRRFYGESDATTRDLKIKPEWDRTLDELRQARLSVEAAKKDLAQFLEDGRQAGALPGWLREGVDQEPAAEPPPPKPTDAIEPPILKIDGRNR